MMMFGQKSIARTLLAAGLLFGLAACEGYDYRPLSLSKAPDCAEQPGKKHGTDYWLKGTSGPFVNWAGCDKRGADLRQANLASVNLRAADLSGAQLSGADLGGAFLDRTNLSGADLTGAKVRGTYFEGANLSGANLTGLDLENTRLLGARLGGATWSDGATLCSEGAVGGCLP